MVDLNQAVLFYVVISQELSNRSVKQHTSSEADADGFMEALKMKFSSSKSRQAILTNESSYRKVTMKCMENKIGRASCRERV